MKNNIMMKVSLISFLLLAVTLQAADWPCYRADAQRTAVTSETLQFPMSAAWIYEPPHPPSPAYVKSVRWMSPDNFYHSKRTPRAQQGTYEPNTVDYSYYPVISRGKVYYGSSTDEGVHCLDAASGKTLWTYYTEGSIRLAPQVTDGRVYVGSDDGKVYCLDANSGKEIWSVRATPNEGYCIGQHRPVSAWPVRGGVTVGNDLVYCGAGMFPEQGVYSTALDPKTGHTTLQQAMAYIAAGPIMLDDDLLWMPTHRTTPTMIDRETLVPVYKGSTELLSRGSAQTFKVAGKTAWGPGEAGLIYIVLDETKPFEGPDKRFGRGDRATSAHRQMGVLTLLYGNAALADDEYFIFVGDQEVTAMKIDDFQATAKHRAQAVIDKSEKYVKAPAFSKIMGFMGMLDSTFEERLAEGALWKQETPERFAYKSAILTGSHLVLGSENKVTVMDKSTGETVWNADVDGTPWGLAAANGTLYAATDKGLIYAFGSGSSSGARQKPALNNPFRDDAGIADAAKAVLGQADRDQGFCAVFGDDTGQLAYEIAKQSRFFTVVFEPDAAQAQTIRMNLVNAGVYGAEVVVRHSTPDTLDQYPDGFANVVAVEAGSSYDPKDVMRLVQPYGGTLAVASGAKGPWTDAQFASAGSSGPWTISHRGDVPGAGQWPHGAGSTANTMSSEESNIPFKGPDFKLQWFGKPYAHDIVDRHQVPVTPLYQNGIMFAPGRTNSLTGVDAYNGTILWKIYQPDSLRMWASHNPSPVACSGDGKHIFAVTSDECWMLDAVTGEKKASFKAMEGLDWGYAGSVDNVLIGTSQGKEVDMLAAGLLGDKKNKIRQTDAWHTSLVSAGKEIFAIDYTTGKRLWTYDKGLVLNPTICIADGKVFFGESRNRTAMENTTGFINMIDWVTEKAQVTALDLKTGQTVWTFPITRALDAPFQWLMFLAYKDDILLKTRTYFVKEGGKNYRGYDVEALEADSGKSIWQRWIQANYPGEARGLAYGKNSLTSWPIMVGDRFYIKSNLFDNNAGATIEGYSLLTGEKIHDATKAGIHHPGCSPAIGSADAIFYRSYHHVSMDLETYTMHEVTGVTRPSCWPNILPAGGLLLAPEGGSGCSCGLSYQLSFALAPK